MCVSPAIAERQISSILGYLSDQAESLSFVFNSNQPCWQLGEIFLLSPAIDVISLAVLQPDLNLRESFDRPSAICYIFGVWQCR